MQYLESILELSPLGTVLALIIGYFLRFLIDENWHEHVVSRVFHSVLREVGSDFAEDYPLLEAFIIKFKEMTGKEPNASQLKTAKDLRDEVIGEYDVKKSENGD